jgi:hypothetical protein
MKGKWTEGSLAGVLKDTYKRLGTQASRSIGAPFGESGELIYRGL